ncbi:hypothetical protein J4464_03175 [Candidatus Woesearchaeota archaeon]|nr:hypothetical protein [Candidatus Woesearchaeota archaeon]
MPHQCVRCNKFYDDGSTALLKGCDCGAKLFFYIKKEKLEAKQPVVKLEKEQREQIENDVMDLIGEDLDHHDPVVLDLESIRVTKPGTYEIDVVHLFRGDPVIFKLEEGKYMIDLLQSLKSSKKAK